jgi:hypothetical protein
MNEKQGYYEIIKIKDESGSGYGVREVITNSTQPASEKRVHIRDFMIVERETTSGGRIKCLAEQTYKRSLFSWPPFKKIEKSRIITLSNPANLDNEAHDRARFEANFLASLSNKEVKDSSRNQ